jgi:hypothetical protein
VVLTPLRKIHATEIFSNNNRLSLCHTGAPLPPGSVCRQVLPAGLADAAT